MIESTNGNGRNTNSNVTVKCVVITVHERHPVRQTRKALAILFAVEEEGRPSPGNEREAK